MCALSAHAKAQSATLAVDHYRGNDFPLINTVSGNSNQSLLAYEVWESVGASGTYTNTFSKTIGDTGVNNTVIVSASGGTGLHSFYFKDFGGVSPNYTIISWFVKTNTVYFTIQ